MVKFIRFIKGTISAGLENSKLALVIATNGNSRKEKVIKWVLMFLFGFHASFIFTEKELILKYYHFLCLIGISSAFAGIFAFSIASKMRKTADKMMDSSLDHLGKAQKQHTKYRDLRTQADFLKNQISKKIDKELHILQLKKEEFNRLQKKSYEDLENISKEINENIERQRAIAGERIWDENIRKAMEKLYLPKFDKNVIKLPKETIIAKNKQPDELIWGGFKKMPGVHND